MVFMSIGNWVDHCSSSTSVETLVGFNPFLRIVEDSVEANMRVAALQKVEADCFKIESVFSGCSFKLDLRLRAVSVCELSSAPMDLLFL
jgi:hypothetical protein